MNWTIIIIETIIMTIAFTAIDSVGENNCNFAASNH